MRKITTFKKLIIAIMLVIALASPSLSFAPVMIPVVAAGSALATAAVAYGVSYFMQNGASPIVSAMGDIALASGAYYAMAVPSFSMVTQNLTAHMPFSTAQNIANTGSYPNVKSAMTNTDKGYYEPAEVPLLPDGSLVGNVAQATDGNYYNVVSVNSTQPRSACYSSSDMLPRISGGLLVTASAGSAAGCVAGTTHLANSQLVLYNVQAVVKPSPKVSPATPDQWQKNYNNGILAGGTLATALQDELRKMFQNPSYVPAFTDDTTGLPWVPPAGVLTPEQLKAENSKQGVVAATAAVTNANKDAIAAGTGASASYRAAADIAVAAAAANPSDPVLKQKAADAVAAADAASANVKTLIATSAAQDATKVDQETLVPESVGTYHTFSWSKLGQLMGIMSMTFPFNLIYRLSTYVGMLVTATPVAPSFDLPIYGGNTIHCSLSYFDPLATFCRWVIALLLSIGAIQLVVGFWRGN